MHQWSSEQYLCYHKERTQPSIDLVSRLPEEGMLTILDIGCGPGNSTNQLYQKYPNAHIIGIDSSEDMIDKARKDYPHLNFQQVDVTKDLYTLNETFDLIFSNACLQWVPNNEKVLQELFHMLNKNGVLAVQVPINQEAPIQRIIHDVVHESKWKDTFHTKRIFYQLTPEAYVDVLARLTDSFDVWTTVYYHRLPSHKDILEWYKGSGLRPYYQQLDEHNKIVFEQEIYNRIIESYPVSENGEVLFPFLRCFFTAIK
ncbi:MULTISPECIES: methyltransferase domain-containing protein [unclassified Breznakia]|uniref:methyltransferase domain-containing protein n=1 Tax=unclassified Breznakia TaxID=2623764 RepID=UPI0024752F2F|nr:MULTISPECIES: methyltransferase domain-containing protein [unclassified Breznakia]MDH6366641.1 trans-aconitate 2-methyltransferase [Breznakia sp. PH1-1]MDH6403734.1 trans-aconitate 2-methyltransferase [Breznakia sp. PF1-11]MDH6411443.1 trans-aconitate 2-methyltransferase [Breznakia sp. PFB1-11]MDH6413826.1 trans-aconitate 2-methyltransferase [Breznakia sp. PFB1-14]MDH6416256.1 trans-aconitate 2-methyltransferase [Breznakia sp. PFB1-4]